MMSSPVVLALALSLVSAFCYAAAAVVQERTAAGKSPFSCKLPHCGVRCASDFRFPLRCCVPWP